MSSSVALPSCSVGPSPSGLMTNSAWMSSGRFFSSQADAVRFATFLVGSEGEDDVAVGDVAFALETDEGRDDVGVGILHVLGAAAVEVAILLDEGVGIGGPVGAAGFDYVFMADDEDGLELGAGRAAITDDEVLLAVVGAGEDEVPGSEASLEQFLAREQETAVTLPSESCELVSMNSLKIWRDRTRSCSGNCGGVGRLDFARRPCRTRWRRAARTPQTFMHSPAKL